MHPASLLALALARRDPFQEAAAAAATAAERECVEYLGRWAPEGDHRSPNITAAFLLDDVRLALSARNASGWAAAVPWPLFLNEVLPYAVLSEPRGEGWQSRRRLQSALLPAAAALPNASAAAEAGVNTLAWGVVQPGITFVAAPNCAINSYAPAQTLRRHNSSCTGLAVYLAMAMRAVGLPARVAGVPHWNKCGGRGARCAACPHGDLCTPGDHSSDDACGNHDWVEVWADGAWHFVDPDGSHTLDDGWFADVTRLQVVHQGAYLNHSILASSWAPSAHLAAAAPQHYPGQLPVSHFPMVWDWGDRGVQGWDVTQRYLKLK